MFTFTKRKSEMLLRPFFRLYLTSGLCEVCEANLGKFLQGIFLLIAVKLSRQGLNFSATFRSEAEEKFKEVAHAYDCLGDKEKKKLYDEFGDEGLRTGFDAEQARRYRQWQSTQQTSGTGGWQNFSSGPC